MSIEIGTPAPQISGKDETGKEIKISDYLGKKLAIYFYPKDDTPGCTEQSCNLRDNIGPLKQAGFEILGVSVDSEKSHVKFKEKFSLPFPLIADTDHVWVDAFGVWVEKSMYGKKYMGVKRTTFIIDEKGMIAKIIDQVKTKEHTEQILS